MVSTREPIQDDIERLALVLAMPHRDRRAVLREAIRRLASDDPIQDVKRVGRVLAAHYKDRDIARIDQTRTIKKGTIVKSHGKRVPTRSEYRKTTRGFRVQFSWRGKWYRKFFSDSKHGGPFGARSAARKWRNEAERSVGRNVTNVRVAVQTYTNGSER